MLRLIDTPSPWPLIHSSPSPSSPPASPPASRHPASLPRLACFSRSGCPHPAHASTASTSSCLAALARCVPCFRLPWGPSTWRVPGRTREAFLMLDKGISWAETLSLGAWAPGPRRTKRFPSRVSVFLYRFTRMQPLGLAWREVGRTREAF